MEKKSVQSIRWLLSLIAIAFAFAFTFGFASAFQSRSRWFYCLLVHCPLIHPSVPPSVVCPSVHNTGTKKWANAHTRPWHTPPFLLRYFFPFLPAAVGRVTLLLFGVCGVFAAPTSQLFISSFPCTRLFLPFSVSHRCFSLRYPKLKKDEGKMKKRGKPCWIDPELAGFSPLFADSKKLFTEDAWNLVKTDQQKFFRVK